MRLEQDQIEALNAWQQGGQSSHMMCRAPDSWHDIDPPGPKVVFSVDGALCSCGWLEHTIPTPILEAVFGAAAMAEVARLEKEVEQLEQLEIDERLADMTADRNEWRSKAEKHDNYEAELEPAPQVSVDVKPALAGLSHLSEHLEEVAPPAQVSEDRAEEAEEGGWPPVPEDAEAPAAPPPLEETAEAPSGGPEHYVRHPLSEPELTVDEENDRLRHTVRRCLAFIEGSGSQVERDNFVRRHRSSIRKDAST